ncbi:hypothetical protein HNQ77_000073 [Silvibacterium bohemicum]|uniref:CopG family transcriptional regulator n=1 Tax=Silvibacterium bohemicum TaxID=1577686 RepID=A0A841JNY1_9BACT|nr:CopG family transcriptional regulator [Silvibacterium bohemicum]MBB6142135.1 hypothetical protein [Silvibacterium bohemicum]
MRTSLTLDDDVLMAAKDLAARQNRSIGEVVSALARQGLRANLSGGKQRNGVPLLPVQPHATPGSLELVNQLRDEQPA